MFSKSTMLTALFVAMTFFLGLPVFAGEGAATAPPAEKPMVSQGSSSSMETPKEVSKESKGKKKKMAKKGKKTKKQEEKPVE